jgi:hypothetical protein
VKRQTYDVAGCYKIWTRVDVRCDEMGRLCEKEWKEFLDGIGERFRF